MNYMDSRTQLINEYKSQTGKDARFKNGKIRKTFLDWNLKQLKDNKTTIYFLKDKLFNPNPNSRRLINIKYDTRYKVRQISKAFKKKYNIENSIAVKKTTDFYEFDIYSSGFSSGEWNNQTELENNNLLNYLINNNNIQGHYRLLITGFDNEGIKYRIKDNSYNIDNNFWKENKEEFRVDSEYMKWNKPLTDEDNESYNKVKFYFTKEKYLSYNYYEQSFLDGVNHCFFEPITDYFKYVVSKAKSKSTQRKYWAKVLLIQGKTLKTGEEKIGLIEKYSGGVPETKIGSICEILQIGVDIEQPFNVNCLYEYRSNKKPLKVFKFVNTRLNHIQINHNKRLTDSIFKNFGREEVENKQELYDIIEKCKKEDELCITTKNNFGLSTVRTLSTAYSLKSEFNETINEFEAESGLKYCGIDSIKYPELTRFINNGTHFNNCVDLKNTDFMRDNKNIPENMKHIDIKKAYTQFYKYKYYNGFCGKITDFRKVDNFKQKGLYLIKNLDITECSKNFQLINEKLEWFKENNIYTDMELETLQHEGGEFEVVAGAYGVKMDFRFEGDMLDKKEIIDLEEITILDPNKQIEKLEKKTVAISIPYYSKYTGITFMDNKTKSFYMKGKEKYFKTIPTNEATSIYYNQEENEAKICYNKKYAYHKKHITAQITAYQRLNLLEQLKKMDISKIYRICVDGIYYEDHDFILDDIFIEKGGMTFKNSATTEYLSNLLINEENTIIDNNFDLAESREFYKNELFKGAGGNGKTYYNLNDKGLINPVFIGHSWKLSTTEQKEYSQKNNEFLPVSVHNRLFKTFGNPEIYKKYSNYIIDEASMITEKQKHIVLKAIVGKVIMCGDINYQLPPLEEGEEMTENDFDNVRELTKNYRFKCEKLKKIIAIMRDCIKNNKPFNINHFKDNINRIKKNQVKGLYNKEDLILVSRHIFNTEYNEILKDIEKYKVIENLTSHKNGEIVYEKIKGVGMELRHGYTIHSIQGETHRKKLFIDMREINNLRMIYTAISRATRLEDIYFITETPEEHKFRKQK